MYRPLFTYRPVCTYSQCLRTGQCLCTGQCLHTGRCVRIANVYVQASVYVQATVYIQAGVYVQANVYVQARRLSACFGAMSVVSTILVLQTFRIFFFFVFFTKNGADSAKLTTVISVDRCAEIRRKCPFSSVTNYGRVWRMGARKRGLQRAVGRPGLHNTLQYSQYSECSSSSSKFL